MSSQAEVIVYRPKKKSPLQLDAVPIVFKGRHPGTASDCGFELGLFEGGIEF